MTPKKYFTLSICLLIFFSFVHCEQSPYNAEFNVQPGGVEHTFTHERDGMVCEFTYICQGGTNEKWMMAIMQVREAGSYGCLVERAGGGGRSYLFFQKFTMSVKGNVELLNGEAKGNGGVPLENNQYKVDKETKSISHVEGKFGSELTKVSLEFIKIGKEKEL